MWILEDCSTNVQYSLFCGKWTIGRGSASTIRVTVNAVSRQHVSLEVDTNYDVTNNDSVMKLTISDMNTKHGTRWNDQSLSSITLTKKEEQGVLAISKTYSFKIYWKSTSFCFSRVASSVKKIYQAKLKQLGCHVISSYLPKQTDYLVVPDHFDVTPKLLQALVECIPIISVSYFKSLEENAPLLQMPNPAEFLPQQDSIQVDVSPHPFRKTILSFFSFHFTTNDSPYIDVISLAGGILDVSSPSSSSSPSQPLAKSIIVFRDPSSSCYTSSMESLNIAMNRVIPPAALEWVRQGWIPFEEQEIMQSLLIEGEFQALYEMNRKRCIMELEAFNKNRKENESEKMMVENESGSETESETESESEKIPAVLPSLSPMKVMSVKRIEPVSSKEDDMMIENFFDQLEDQMKEEKKEMIVEKEIVQVPEKRRKVERKNDSDSQKEKQKILHKKEMLITEELPKPMASFTQSNESIQEDTETYKEIKQVNFT